MRRHKAVFFIALPLVTMLVACGASPDADDAELSSDALRRRDVEPPPPPPKKPPKKPPIAVSPVDVLAPPEPWCGTTRIDLRRVNRTCEDLPGAFIENGTTYVAGESGRFKVERTLAATSAPDDAKEKTCTFTWEPATCGAPPATAKLLIELPEQLVPRSPGCEYMPMGCGIIAVPPEATPGSIPTGLGRCEVCGFAANDHMWAVLPSNWSSFSYVVGSERRFVQLNASTPVYEMNLAGSVGAQSFPLYKGDSAPQ